MVFEVVNERLTLIQIQLRRGFLELQEFIGDIALDELAADLDSTMRQLNQFMSATNETRVYYDASLRAYCNEPFHAPQDLFYNLYGYACSNCSFAPRKRADIRSVARRSNEISQANFLSSFGNFILFSMLNAMFLHSVCLPPIAGSCVDRSTDITWRNGTMDMAAAFNESVAVIQNTAEQLGDWVNLLTIDQLIEFFPSGVDNLVAAESVLNFLNRTQPDFDIQVLVADLNRQGDFIPANIFRRGCSKSTETCRTTRTNTGHFWFDINNNPNKALSIRYRLKTLGPASNMILIDAANIRPFPEFFNEVADRLNVETSVELPDSDACRLEIISSEISITPRFPRILRVFPACLIGTCVSCSDMERLAFDAVLASQSYYIFRVGFNNVQVVSNNATSFNVFNPIVGEKFLLNSAVNEFTFYYN
jgi:hypothetical protein